MSKHGRTPEGMAGRIPQVLRGKASHSFRASHAGRRRWRFARCGPFVIIRPHRQVKAIFYSHSHSWNISERAAVKLINLPALGYNFWEGESVGWVDARFRRTGVDLTLHAIAGNRAQDGQISRILWT